MKKWKKIKKEKKKRKKENDNKTEEGLEDENIGEKRET